MSQVSSVARRITMLRTVQSMLTCALVQFRSVPNRREGQFGIVLPFQALPKVIDLLDLVPDSHCLVVPGTMLYWLELDGVLLNSRRVNSSSA